VHKSREKDDHGYDRLTQIGNQLDLLLDKLELKFIDFQTCLAIVDMLLKEERALEVDYNDLKNFHRLLEDEMNKLNDWFSGGTFYLNNFLSLHLIDVLNITFLFYLTFILVFATANKAFMSR
jgi:hypothetical protein